MNTFYATITTSPFNPSEGFRVGSLATCQLAYKLLESSSLSFRHVPTDFIEIDTNVHILLE